MTGLLGLLGLILWYMIPGCSSGKPNLQLYSDQPRSVVDPLIQQFEREKGIDVHVVYATPQQIDSGQGLSTQLREATGAPPADVYWACGPEAIRQLGLESYSTFLTEQIDSEFRDVNHYWVGMNLRVRAILYNTHLVSNTRVPKSIASLAQPVWKGRCAMADPRTNGSAHYHLLILFAVLQENEAKRLLEQMKANNVQFLPNEAAVVDAVANGTAAWGVVDSDMAEAAVRAGKPVKYVVADQEPYSTGDAMGKLHGDIPTLGTPMLPAPLVLLKNRPNILEGRQLFDYLVSEPALLKLAELQPTRLPTYSVLLDRLAKKPDPKVLNPRHLNIASTPAKSLDLARPQLNLALSEILGSAPH